MYHQLIEEIACCDDDDEEYCDRVFYKKSWRSSFESLSSRLNTERDSVIYLAGCDHFDYIPNEKEELSPVAYKYSPIDMLHKLKWKRPIKVFIVATAYKLNAESLCELIKF